MKSFVASIVALPFLALPFVRLASPRSAAEEDRKDCVVRRADDFEISGKGDDPSWEKADWVSLRRREKDGLPYETRFKTLYSETGIYFLIEGTDSRLTATFEKDFENLWTEDVFEVFLWTDERHPVYFEYEISPLNVELPILIPNFEGRFLGWRPWHYEGQRRIVKKTSAIGGKVESGADVEGWRAEFKIPYDLLRPLQNVPPRKSAVWRANVYRFDHDGGRPTSWDWSPVGKSFHEYQSFGSFRFE